LKKKGDKKGSRKRYLVLSINLLPSAEVLGFLGLLLSFILRFALLGRFFNLLLQWEMKKDALISKPKLLILRDKKRASSKTLFSFSKI
jgi:hypothetical protein